MLLGNEETVVPHATAYLYRTVCHHQNDIFKKVRMRLVVVVVVVRELLFLVTSLIYMRMEVAGQRLPQRLNHTYSDSRLKQCSYHNEFVALFLRYLSHKHKTYRYSV